MKSIILSMLVFNPNENFLSIKPFTSNMVNYVTVVVNLKSNDFKKWKLMKSCDLKTWEDTGFLIKEKTSSYTEKAYTSCFFELREVK